MEMGAMEEPTLIEKVMFQHVHAVTVQLILGEGKKSETLKGWSLYSLSCVSVCVFTGYRAHLLT